MRTLGNVIWFLAAGLWSWIAWTVIGLVLCLSVIGIPFGMQCFKIARFGLFPFGKEVIPSTRTTSLLFNLIWIILCGWELFLLHIGTAVFLCCTIIGIPFAIQSLKLAMLGLFPFGISIEKH
ncbi:YccF domain-containing protein [Streptococcus hillyeri]|uniref:YccF domain-containing protein n=1 Tax=Streptococcus hillyeri TaxID=2282420 RepID=A0A3L9DWS3_9STRE|nr:YccF domain-containing protein [Streptococcus hillyeri]RLY04169.1 YccF domain-containing protein [Streptococcus hillyeri]